MALSRRMVLCLPIFGHILYAAGAAAQGGQGGRPRRPDPVGTKFNEDGTVRTYPGNTIVSHVPAAAPAWTALVAARDRLKDQSFSSGLSLLPPASYHMTIFDGVVDAIRVPDRWPTDLPLDAPLSACTALFAKKLRTFDLGCDPPFRLRPASFTLGGTALAFQLDPVDAAENKRLRDLRDRLSRHLALRKPDHDRYVFHVSMAYLVNWMTPDQERAFTATTQECLAAIKNVEVFELGAPAFCVFQDMFAFHEQFELRRLPR